MTAAKSIRALLANSLVCAAFAASSIPLAHSDIELTDSQLEEKAAIMAQEALNEDINIDDYIGFKVPAVQLLLLDASLSGISMQDIFSDELNGRLQFEVELTTEAFTDQSVKVRPTWYDADGNKVDSSDGWERVTIIPKSLNIIDLVAPNSKAKEVILHIKP